MFSLKRNVDLKLVLDTETTTSNKGNPFDKTNFLVQIGLKQLNGESLVLDFRNGFNVKEIQSVVDSSKLIIGFNLKFDLHWLRRLGINIENISVWDCQLAEFILDRQKTPYNSLNDALIKYGLPVKLDVVKTEYWDKGIDTDRIPVDILSEYLRGDLSGTELVYLRQLEEFKNRG